MTTCRVNSMLKNPYRTIRVLRTVVVASAAILGFGIGVAGGAGSGGTGNSQGKDPGEGIL